MSAIIGPTGVTGSAPGIQALLDEAAERYQARARQIRASRRSVRGFLRWAWFGWQFPEFAVRLEGGTLRTGAALVLREGVGLAGGHDGTAVEEVPPVPARFLVGSRIGLRLRSVRYRLIRSRPDDKDDGDWGDDDE